MRDNKYKLQIQKMYPYICLNIHVMIVRELDIHMIEQIYVG